ncbi:MAG TPA: hypothetical protein VF484_01390 [Candidatus Limnocylindrales bacterium]
MSGRRSRGQGWEQPTRTPPWVYALVGVLLTLAVVLAIAVFLLLGGSPGGLASASSTPTLAAATSAPADTGASASAVASPAPSVVPTEAPTPEATPEPTPQVTPAPGASASPLPSGSVKPTLVSMTVQHTADCNKDYGNGVGMIKISWTSIGTTGVRISIDPPSAATAYGYGYKDEPSSGSDWVPFTCGLGVTSHLYVITTLHTTGYYQYRYTKVTQSPLPSATP